MDVFAEVCEALRQNELAWSPDGKQIAFTSVLERRLAVMDVDGVGQPKSMLNNPTSVDVMGCSFSGLDWSPDGQTLAVRGQTPDVPDMGLVAIDVRTGASRRLVPGSDDRDMDPAWYPVQP